MSIEEIITSTLSDFGIPVQKSPYIPAEDATASLYYTYNVSTFGVFYADDAPQKERCIVMLHLFSPIGIDLGERIEQTKKALFSAGFSWPSTVDASDEFSQHYAFECEYINDLE